jgi:hypothetical protein
MPTTICVRTIAGSPRASKPRCRACCNVSVPSNSTSGWRRRARRFLPANRKARQWELLLELYEDIAKEAQEDFWSVFEREFRRAYSTGQGASPSKG